MIRYGLIAKFCYYNVLLPVCGELSYESGASCLGASFIWASCLGASCPAPFVKCLGKIKKDDINLALECRISCNFLYGRDES